MRIGQTVSFVQMMNKRFGRHSTTTMDVWEAIDRLSEFVDVSDPDVALPNAVHLYVEYIFWLAHDRPPHVPPLHCLIPSPFP